MSDRANTAVVASPRRVVIVGGGLAGMSAAEAMARSFGDRVQITLIEAKRLTGGRAGSFTDAARDETIDYCQHVAMGCCTNLVALLQRCGLADVLVRHSSLPFYHPVFPVSEFAASEILPPPFHLARAIGQLQFLDRRQRRQVRRGMFAMLRSRDQDLRGQTAADWLRRHGQDDDTIGEFWGTIVVSALGEEIEKVDVSAVRKVMVDGFASARGASDVLVPSIPLSDLFGKRLPSRVAELGVDVRTGCAASGIGELDGGVTVETSHGETIQADHVVIAVPWHAIDGLFPDDAPISSIREFASIPSSAITGVHLWFDREITNKPLLVLVGTVAQWLFRPRWRSPQMGDLLEPSPAIFAAANQQGTYYQVVISASNKWRSLKKESLVAAVIGDLKSVLPEARDAELLHSRVVTDPHSVFSLRPEVAALRPAASTPLPWLHLAGDWIDTGWPATMEGAVISGRMAANSIAACEGWSPVEIDPGLPRSWLARALIR